MLLLSSILFINIKHRLSPPRSFVEVGLVGAGCDNGDSLEPVLCSGVCGADPSSPRLISAQPGSQTPVHQFIAQASSLTNIASEETTLTWAYNAPAHSFVIVQDSDKYRWHLYQERSVIGGSSWCTFIQNVSSCISFLWPLRWQWFKDLIELGVAIFCNSPLGHFSESQTSSSLQWFIKYKSNFLFSSVYENACVYVHVCAS